MSHAVRRLCLTEEEGPETWVGAVESPDPRVQHVVSSLWHGEQRHDKVAQCVGSREGKRNAAESDRVFLPDQEIPQALFEVGQHEEQPDE